MTTRGKASRNVPSVGDRIIGSLTRMKDSLQRGEPLTKKFTVRTVELDLQPQEYSPHQIRQVRDMLNVSQAIFAKLLGVTVHSVRSWEQGKREPNLPVRRLLQEIESDPIRWMTLLKNAAHHRHSAVA